MFVACQQLLSTNAYCGSACGAVLAKKSGMAGTNKTQIGSELENLETWYSGLQTARNLVKPIDLNYLEA